jgi:hypothetical protein
MSGKRLTLQEMQVNLGERESGKEQWWNLTWFRKSIDRHAQAASITDSKQQGCCVLFTRLWYWSWYQLDHFDSPPLSIPNVTMASIMRNVVHWGSQRQKTPVQVDLCEVFRFTTLFNVWCWFCAKICGKKPKFVDKGFKHPYCSRSCARNGGQGPSPTACVFRGCRATGKPAFANFCSEAHARYTIFIHPYHLQITFSPQGRGTPGPSRGLWVV